MSAKIPESGHKAVDEFLRDVQRHQASETYDSRKTDLSSFIEWCQDESIKPAEATGRHIHRFMGWLIDEGYAQDTVYNRFSSLSVFFGWLSGPKAPPEVTRDDDPTDDLSRADYKIQSREADDDTDTLKFVTTEEVNTLCEHVRPPALKNELILRLMFQTGVRQSELIGMKTENVDRENRSIRIFAPKTGDWRTVYYQPSLDFLMSRWLDTERIKIPTAEESPYLFPAPRNERHYSRHVNDIVTTAADRAGIQEVTGTDKQGKELKRITSHALRHGHARRAVKSGIQLPTLKQHLGHTDITMTQKYLQFAPDDLKDAYEDW